MKNTTQMFIHGIKLLGKHYISIDILFIIGIKQLFQKEVKSISLSVHYECIFQRKILALKGGNSMFMIRFSCVFVFKNNRYEISFE